MGLAEAWGVGGGAADRALALQRLRAGAADSVPPVGSPQGAPPVSTVLVRIGKQGHAAWGLETQLVTQHVRAYGHELRSRRPWG